MEKGALMKPRRSIGIAAAVAASALASGVGRADDLSGIDRLLCSTNTAIVCVEDGTCEKGVAWEFKVPQFIEIDLKTKRLSTTASSGENRATTADSLRRADGTVVLQGLEQGRAFSMVIHEKSGSLTAAVARDGITVTVFGA